MVSDIFKLNEIVLDMLAQNMTDDQIVLSLQQSGLDEKSAKQVLEKAKASFERTLSEKFDVLVEKKVNQKLDEKFQEYKKDLSLKQDLRFMEQKEYTDKKVKEEQKEVDSLKSEVVGLKLREETAFKRMDDKINLLKMSGSTQKLIAVALIVAAVFSVIAIFSFSSGIITHIINKDPIDFMFFIRIFIIIISAIIGYICLKTGYKIYSLGEKQFERVGLEFIENRKKQEEGSIQELVKDKEVI